MLTKPCEVCMTYGDGEQHDCGQPARLNVNGFPMCARHFHDFEDEEQIESVGMFTEPQGAPACPECERRSEIWDRVDALAERVLDTAKGAPQCDSCGQQKRDVPNGSKCPECINGHMREGAPTTDWPASGERPW